eukprot:3709502-Pleurochrysis_carterae.AAC.1
MLSSGFPAGMWADRVLEREGLSACRTVGATHRKTKRLNMDSGAQKLFLNVSSSARVLVRASACQVSQNKTTE